MDTNVLIFLAVFIFCFIVLTLTFPKFRVEILYTFAIGGAINSNIFNVETYGFDLFGMRFGIDSILYSLFVFCVILTYLKSGRKDAVKLMLYTIVSLLFTAIISFFGTLLAVEHDTRGIMWTLLSFTISSIASFVALYFMICIADKLKQRTKNNYLLILIMFVIAIILNTLTFYGIMHILGGVSSNFMVVLLGNTIGKIMCLLLCLLSFFFIEIIMKKMELKNKNSQNN